MPFVIVIEIKPRLKSASKDGLFLSIIPFLKLKQTYIDLVLAGII